jgi:hypothetical protein
MRISRIRSDNELLEVSSALQHDLTVRLRHEPAVGFKSPAATCVHRLSHNPAGSRETSRARRWRSPTALAARELDLLAWGATGSKRDRIGASLQLRWSQLPRDLEGRVFHTVVIALDPTLVFHFGTCRIPTSHPPDPSSPKISHRSFSDFK